MDSGLLLCCLTSYKPYNSYFLLYVFVAGELRYLACFSLSWRSLPPKAIASPLIFLIGNINLSLNLSYDAPLSFLPNNPDSSRSFCSNSLDNFSYNEGDLIFEYPNLKNLAVSPEIPLSFKYLIVFFPKS